MNWNVNNIGGSGTVDIIVSATRDSTNFTGSGQFTVLAGTSYTLTLTIPVAQRQTSNPVAGLPCLMNTDLAVVSTSVPGTPSNISSFTLGSSGSCTYYVPAGVPTVTLAQQ